MWVQSPGWEDPLGEGHGDPLHVLASRIPWKEARGRLQVHGGLKRVLHNNKNNKEKDIRKETF